MRLHKIHVILFVGIFHLAHTSIADSIVPEYVGVDVKRGYADTKYGQLHYYQAKPTDDSSIETRIPVVMLHQSPTSAAEYGPLVSEMGKDRVAIAIDTPGYGGSDGPTTLPDIVDYATAIAEGLRNLGYGKGKPVNIVGYHTGALIAVELAIVAPDLINKIALVGVYDVAKEQYEKAFRELEHPQSHTELFTAFCERLPESKEYYSSLGVPDSSWGNTRIDYLRSGLSRGYGHHAAYRYAAIVGEQFPKVEQPVLLVAVGDSLRAATIASQSKFKNATVLDVPHFKGAIFIMHSKRIGRHLRDFYDR